MASLRAIPHAPHPRRGAPVPATTRPRRLLALLLGLTVLLAPGTAAAKGDDPAAAEDGGGTTATGTGGDFAVTVNGRTTNPAAGSEARLRDVTPTKLRGVRIGELRLRDDVLVAEFTTAAGKLKVQAKDAPQGGIFQMEQEFGGPVEYVHTLGPTLFYFVNEYTGKINFGDGVPGDATHQMLLGKDSPQVATKLFQDGRTTRWSVASGGRMGGVLGEDAIELSAGATNCTSDCQARNRIQGSVPVPPLPVDPTPIG